MLIHVAKDSFSALLQTVDFFRFHSFAGFIFGRKRGTLPEDLLGRLLYKLFHITYSTRASLSDAAADNDARE